MWSDLCALPSGWWCRKTESTGFWQHPREWTPTGHQNVMSPAASAAAASTRSENITSNKDLNVSIFHISAQLFQLFARLLSANVLSGKAHVHIYLHWWDASLVQHLLALLIHWSMDPAGSQKVCCGIWHQEYQQILILMEFVCPA